MRLKFILPLLLALGCTASGGRPSARAGIKAYQMMVHIDLQDGFQNDEVIIRLDGKQVFHKTVSTDIRISRADGFQVLSGKADSVVEIEIAKRQVKGSQSFKPAGTPNVGISIREGKPEFRLSAEPFLYL